MKKVSFFVFCVLVIFSLSNSANAQEKEVCSEKKARVPLYFGSGPGRGGIPPMSGDHYSATFSARDLQFSSEQQSMISGSFIAKPLKCKPLSFGVEYTQFIINGNPNSNETLFGVNYGVNPSATISIIRRQDPNLGEGYGVSGGVKYSW